MLYSFIKPQLVENIAKLYAVLPPNPRNIPPSKYSCNSLKSVKSYTSVNVISKFHLLPFLCPITLMSVLFNAKNTLHQLNKSFPEEIQEVLNYDFQYYRRSTKDEDIDMELYNYILKYQHYL